MTKKNKKYYLFQMDTTALNVVSIAILLLLFFTLDLTYPTFWNDLKISYFNNRLVLVIILYIGYLLLHELLHSLAYVIYGAKYDKVVYGAALEKGVLYCLCKQNISRKNILHSLLYPFFFIGILTFILSIVFHLPILFILSVFNLSGCSGDLIMFAYIVKLNKDVEFSEYDSPIAFGIYADYDVSKIRHVGLKYIESTDKLERNDFKKINISEPSKIIGILIIVLGVIAAFL